MPYKYCFNHKKILYIKNPSKDFQTTMQKYYPFIGCISFNKTNVKFCVDGISIYKIQYILLPVYTCYKEHDHPQNHRSPAKNVFVLI